MTITPEQIAELRHRIADVGKVGTSIYLASSVPGVRHGPAIPIRCDDLSALLDLAESALAAKPAAVEEIDWGKVPEWVTHVAKDDDEQIWMYEYCPRKMNSHWLPEKGRHFRVSLRRCIVIPGPWDQSLRKRP